MRSNWLDFMLKLDYPFLFLLGGLTLRCTNHVHVTYTFDVGPNAVVIARNWKIGALLLQRLLYNFPPQSNTDLDRYTINLFDSWYIIYVWNNCGNKSIGNLIFICFWLHTSYIIGDKSILQDVGIKNLKNVEALTALLDVNLCRSMMVYK